MTRQKKQNSKMKSVSRSDHNMPGPNNVPPVVFNPKRRYLVSFQNNDVAKPGGFSGSLSYGQLMAGLVKQLSEHKPANLQDAGVTQFLVWRNIALIKARAWGVPFIQLNGAEQVVGNRFSLILLADAQAKPSTEREDTATGASDRPYAEVTGGPLNWGKSPTNAVNVLTFTDTDRLHALVEVW